MNPPFNILYYVASHDRVDSGGANVLLRIIRRLDGLKFRAHCLASSEGPLLQALINQQVGVIRSPVGSISPRYPVRSYCQLRRMQKLLRTHRIALVHRFDFGWNDDFVIAARLCGIPVILHEHSDGEARLRNLNRFAAEKVVFCSEAQRNSFGFVDRIRNKSRVIYNSVDLDRFAACQNSLRRECGFNEEHLVIGTVALITKEKGIDLLLSAAAALAPRWGNLRVLVVGPFDPKQENYCRAVKEQALQPPLTGKVVFAGSRRDIPELLNTMDIFVFPSLFEAFALAPLEAMAARLPVVASRVGGTPELLLDAPKTGRLVAARSATALAEAIEPFLSDSSLRRETGECARQSLIGRFDEGTVARQIERLYLDAIAGAK